MVRGKGEIAAGDIAGLSHMQRGQQSAHTIEREHAIGKMLGCGGNAREVDGVMPDEPGDDLAAGQARGIARNRPGCTAGKADLLEIPEFGTDAGKYGAGCAGDLQHIGHGGIGVDNTIEHSTRFNNERANYARKINRIAGSAVIKQGAGWAEPVEYGAPR